LQEDSATIRARAEFAITQFHSEWRRAWLLSERTRMLASDKNDGILRNAYIHCHNDRAANNIAAGKLMAKGVRNLMPLGNPLRPEYVVRSDTTFSLINGKESAFGVCPTWLMTPIEHGRDEADARDGALMALTQDYIRERREQLLVTLHSASRQLPGDGWVSGQRVRFHIDQGNWQLALDAARGCRAEAWWCRALEGFTLGRAGRVLMADSAFARMRDAMSAAQQCAWSNIAILLPKDERDDYARLTCGERTALNERIWWLADPLFREPGNERYVQQEVRRIEALLRQATAHDERYAWYAARGGDALHELIQRYGWPSYTAWGGAATDKGHSQWLETYVSPSAEPYTTFEYSLGRIRTLPSWDAARNPFESVTSDWRLAAEGVDGEPLPSWWPDEHFRPRKRIVELEEGQTAFFRRQSSLHLATALRLQHPSIATEATFDAVLLKAPAPNRVDSVALATARGGSKVVLQGVTDPLPAVLAVEAASRTLDARVRFGVVPPPTLASMRPGEIALSDPVLLERGSDAPGTLAGDDVLDAMIPSSALAANERNVRVFWESYGINSGDTVTVSIRVSGDATVGRLRRIGIALNLSSDPNNSVALQWTEPNAQRATRTLVGPVTVQMRLLSFNLTQLAPGPYLIEISMQKGTVIARSQRRFSLLP
jgi:hypothetical protein